MAGGDGDGSGYAGDYSWIEIDGKAAIEQYAA